MTTFKGGGILFTSLYKNKLYFLLGRENKFCVNGAGKWCDFGGGVDKNEKSIKEAVSREASEELSGFLGIKSDILETLLKSKNNFTIDNDGYRIFIVPTEYDENLPTYFNNNQQIIQKYVSANIRKTNKIFEKDKIKYFTINDLKRCKEDLRHFFKVSADKIIDKEKEIILFIKENKRASHTRHTRKIRRRRRTETGRGRGEKVVSRRRRSSQTSNLNKTTKKG